MFIFLKNLVTDVKDSKKNPPQQHPEPSCSSEYPHSAEVFSWSDPFRISLLSPWWELAQPSSCPSLGLWPWLCPPACPADLSPPAAARAMRVVVLN